MGHRQSEDVEVKGHRCPNIPPSHAHLQAEALLWLKPCLNSRCPYSDSKVTVVLGMEHGKHVILSNYFWRLVAAGSVPLQQGAIKVHQPLT